MSEDNEPVWRSLLAVGDSVSFMRQGAQRNQWWKVRAISGENDRFVVLTQQRVGKPKGALRYTIIDWERGVRGPCNLVGQGWPFDPEDDADVSARALADALERWVRIDRALLVGEIERIENEAAESPFATSVEVSYRNKVPIVITDMLLPGERLSRRRGE